jgi:DNA-binding LacI/PurR family transcriptional regulator
LTPASRHDKTVYHSSNDLSDRRLAISTTRRPRIADVARLAKVSPAVVSVVVNGRTDSTIRISPETKQRVWQAVQETGYVANPVAQRLAHGKNRLLGVFTHEPVFPVDQRSFYYPFLVGIEREAEARGYDLLLFTSAHGADGVRSIFRDGANRLLVASGSVLLGWAQDRGEIRRLAEANYPFTYVGRREIEGLSIPFAAADYAAATEQIVDHLVQLGHRRILYLSSLPEREAGIDRRLGFVRAMLRHGLELPATLSTRHDPGDITGAEVRAWVADGWTAVVLESDILAERLLPVARACGLSVPDDISLAVLGDPLVFSEPSMAWTTFRIPRFEMGRTAAALLLDMIEDPTTPVRKQTFLPCTFSSGSTTGPAKGVTTKNPLERSTTAPSL